VEGLSQAWQVHVERLSELLGAGASADGARGLAAVESELRALERAAFDLALAEDRVNLERLGGALSAILAQS
jgi:hypothetical protein